MKFSVAMCTYNGAEFITEQLDSILCQKMPVAEIVICDDGSADGTMHILRSYEARLPHIIKVYTNKKTLGTVRNFEKAISLCQNEYILLSDQDDIWFADKTEKITDFFKANPKKKAVFHNLQYYNGEPKKNTTFDHYLYNPDVQTDLLSHLVLRGNVVTGAALAFKSIGSVKFDDSPGFLHDAQLAIYFAKEDNIGCIKECLGYYRIHPKQQIGSAEEMDAYQEKLEKLWSGADFSTKANFLKKTREAWQKKSTFIDTDAVLRTIDNKLITQRNQFLATLPFAKRKSLILWWILQKKHKTEIKDLLYL